ncbi:Uncharacterised protein [Mycobacterium tuberculosis]|nr:Uncharacterised protein [Mycobacterium tuberculosis]
MMLATWFLSTVSTMSNLTSLPSTLVTVTLTLNVRSLIFISQFSSAPTSAGRSLGHVTDSGLLPAASVILAVICRATSALLTECECDVPIENEQAVGMAIRAVAAPEASSVRTIE